MKFIFFFSISPINNHLPKSIRFSLFEIQHVIAIISTLVHLLLDYHFFWYLGVQVVDLSYGWKEDCLYIFALGVKISLTILQFILSFYNTFVLMWCDFVI